MNGGMYSNFVKEAGLDRWSSRGEKVQKMKSLASGKMGVEAGVCR